VELQKIRGGVSGVQVSEEARLPQPPQWARGSGNSSPWNGAGKMYSDGTRHGLVTSWEQL
jgi:hypothetical protein